MKKTTKPVTVNLAIPLYKRIEAYRKKREKEEGRISFSVALRKLLVTGLNQESN